MFTVYYLTQVAQIHGPTASAVSLDDREMLYHDASIVHTTCVAYQSR